jgi:hypothetical protein
MRKVIKTDSTCLKKTEFYGADSFIKELSRPGRRVARIIDPVKGRVVLGAPFPEARLR